MNLARPILFIFAASLCTIFTLNAQDSINSLQSRSPLYFVTRNKGKLKEIKDILPQIESFNADLQEIQDRDPKKIISAKLQEARQMMHAEGIDDVSILVEDTSLYIDALGGFPGPYLKWFTECVGYEGLYQTARGRVPNQQKYTASARTIIGFYEAKNGEIQFFESDITGQIIEIGRGDGNNWYRYFIPDGTEKTYAEMTPEEKKQYSMRSIAAEKLKMALEA